MFALLVVLIISIATADTVPAHEERKWQLRGGNTRGPTATFPTSKASVVPSSLPSIEPSSIPTHEPTAPPTTLASNQPSDSPTVTPDDSTSSSPTIASPTYKTSAVPSSFPSMEEKEIIETGTVHSNFPLLGEKHQKHEKSYNNKDNNKDTENRKGEWKGRPEEKTIENAKKEKDVRRRRVFLKYRHANNKTDAMNLIKVADENQIELGNPTLSVHYDFHEFNTMVVTATEDEINELLQNNDIFVGVEDDVERSLIPDVHIGETEVRRSDHSHDGSGGGDYEQQNSTRSNRKLIQEIPYGIQMVHALDAHRGNITGQGVKVCVIDSGIDRSHEDFITSHLSGWPVGGNESWSADSCSHGSHVAGTIAASDNGQGVVGVAPEADLHIIRVFGDDCFWSFASRVVDAAIKCKDAGAKVISMSLGGTGSSNEEESVFKTLKDDYGILSVAAAGNAGDTRLTFPASYDSVMSIAAVDSDRKHAAYSQHNDRVNLAAPGSGIKSTIPSGELYNFKSGTSMATPHVAGVAALLLQVNPNLTPQELWDTLCDTAQDRPPNGRDDFRGCGIVDARAAVDFYLDSPVPYCSNDPPEYEDSGGWACEVFEKQPNYCLKYGSTYANVNFDDRTANDACCICNGGRINNIAAQPPPTPAPDFSQGACVDLKHNVNGTQDNWYDEDGPVYSCAWYEESDIRCDRDGSLFRNVNAQPPMVANEACCVCGGGEDIGSDNSTPSPTTVQPTPMPTRLPTLNPSSHPSSHPSEYPSSHPSGSPSGYPTENPSAPPSEHSDPTQSTSQPTTRPTPNSTARTRQYSQSRRPPMQYIGYRQRVHGGSMPRQPQRNQNGFMPRQRGGNDNQRFRQRGGS